MPKGVYKRKPITEEHRRKLSKALSGTNHPMFGKKHSPESLAKMSAAHKNQIITQETREKMRLSMKGKRPKNLDLLHKTFKGEKSALWKGEAVKNVALHQWVYRWKGKPEKCQECGATKKEKRLTWANINHKYRRNLNDFIGLCYKCHQQYDIKHNNFRTDARFKKGHIISEETKQKISKTMKLVRSK